MSIGAYEHGEARPKEHERCGSHLVGPMLLTTAAGNLAAERAPERYRSAARAAAALGAVAASVEIVRLDDAPSRAPGRARAREAGSRAAAPARDARADAAQLEVAEAALQACLELER